MALTLSVGFLVDDAIVVLENTTRHIERGEKPFSAAIISMGEITNTVGEGFNSLAWNKARARSLLLIKPPGMNSNEPFLRSGFESLLLDIPPTIYDAIDINYPWEFDGISLLDHNTYKQQRFRYYHFFNKIGANEWTDEMRRYIFVNGEISFDQTISLTNNE